MSSDISNYPILSINRNNTFFDSIFLKKIQDVINNAESEYVQNNNIIESGKITQRRRIVNDYIVPLSYLIYSFIYTKYYNYQLKTQMILENKLYYSMFGYIFKHNNPVIKKVNVNLYNYFKNEKVVDNSYISHTDIIDQKKKIATFLESTIIPKMKDDNDYKLFEKYNSILDYFNKITLDTVNIIKNLKVIIEKINLKKTNDLLKYFKGFKLDGINSLNKTDELYKKINDFITKMLEKNTNKFTKVNFISIFNDLSSEKQDNFNDYEEYYYKLLDTYKNMIKKIEFINTQIIELNNEDNLIYYDNINLYSLVSSYKKYYSEYIARKKIKDDIDNKIINIKTIKLSIDQKIEVYEELFSNNKNINSNKKIKNGLYLAKIDEINKKINYNIEKLKTQSIKSNDNVHFTQLLNYFIKCFIINENIENNYIKIIFSKNSQNNNIINIKENITELQKNKIIFNNLFKDYKKINKNSENKNLEKKEKENILKLDSINILIKSYEKNINSSTIDSNIKQLESKISTTNDQLKDAKKDLEEIEKKKDRIENIKDKINLKNFIEDNNIKKLKTKKESEIKKLEKDINELNTEIESYKDLISQAKLKGNQRLILSYKSEIKIFEIEIEKKNEKKESIEKEISKLESISNIIKKKGTILTNKNIDEINSINKSMKKNVKKELILLIKPIEDNYLKDNSSSSSDFSSKNIYKRIFIILNYYNRASINKEKDIDKFKKELTNLKNNKNIKKIKKYKIDIYSEIKVNLEDIFFINKRKKT